MVLRLPEPLLSPSPIQTKKSNHKNFLYLQKPNVLALIIKNCYIFSKESFSYISSKENFSNISGNGTLHFLSHAQKMKEIHPIKISYTLANGNPQKISYNFFNRNLLLSFRKTEPRKNSSYFRR